MKISQYKIEYQTGRVPMIQSNLLVQDVKDMETIEFWEDRLKALNQPFAVAYREVGESVLYSIFTDLGGKGSAFR